MSLGTPKSPECLFCKPRNPWSVRNMLLGPPAAWKREADGRPVSYHAGGREGDEEAASGSGRATAQLNRWVAGRVLETVFRMAEERAGRDTGPFE